MPHSPHTHSYSPHASHRPRNRAALQRGAYFADPAYGQENRRGYGNRGKKEDEVSS